MPPNKPVFSVPSAGQIAHGELAGATSAAQMPNVPCFMVVFKAKYDNAGTVAIGKSNAVTLPAGTTTTTAGFPLRGNDREAYYVTNLNLLWYITTNSGDALSYTVYSD